MKIGVIGIGRMGRAIVERYASNGYELFGWNRTIDKIKDIKVSNFKALNSPREVCDKAELIFVALSDIEAVRDVFHQREGLLEGLNQNNIVLNITTITPKAAIEFNKEVTEKGAIYVDLPVLGNPNKIRKGELPMLFGGDKNVLDEIRPILMVLGKKIIYVGEIGKASALKLIFNMVLPSVVILLSEALNIGKKAGLSDDLVLEALMESPLSAAIKRYYDRMTQSNPPASFTMNLMLKDLEYLTRMTYDLRIPTFIPTVTKELLKSAVVNGYSDVYYAKIHDYLKRLSGLSE